MATRITLVNTEEHDPRFNMPYTPAIKVLSGRPVYLAGVTAAPVYHSHPHVAQEFGGIPGDPAEQARMCIQNLERVLESAGGRLSDVVDMTRYIVDVERNQDAINRVLGQRLGDHRPATTTVEVVRLATDPRLLLEIHAVAYVAE
ncbi:MAG TPA: Rid family hydrolase [Acidimicrobiia bacterium]|nr:Rid family hydrolase [Acidimicrobiia bacterium]